MKLAVGPDAVADIRSARDHYEAATPGLGDQFGESLDQLLGRLQVFPRSAPIVVGYEDVRRALLRGFPYAAFYRLGSDRIDVLRVLHTARHTDHSFMSA